MPEPRVVLHVINCLNVGGTEQQLYELIRRLDRRRFRSLLATFKPGGDLRAPLEAHGITPVVLDLGGSLTSAPALLAVARMAWLCRRERVDVVHAHDFYSNVIGVAAARLAGVRSIASRRDLADWLGPPQRRALRLALRLADCVLANAEAVGRLAAAEQSVSSRKLRVVPNGIDVARFDALAAADPGLPAVAGGAPRIVVVASMNRQDKGHGDLLEAAARVQATGRAAQWLLVSDGSLRPSLEERARALGLRDVCFLGKRSDVPAILARADLVVHPSWTEGFPNAVLEAMCAGRPVVAARVGGVPEVMLDGETGLLVEPRRPEQLAEAIVLLLANAQARRTLGGRGRARVIERFTVERMTATVEELYGDLIGRAPLAQAA
jgi:glycosyltransferase involved in cell wall biosynthesis